ncbi:hypothetical protein [Kitasatospora camelliae]|uniref:Uncharacterized protein n=1 Tax=Kitasatospora camelliae TaxID=3156397 RepID=A0AAU8K6R6_9ACTN
MTLRQRLDETASVLIALGELNSDATPIERDQAAHDAMADHRLGALSLELLYRLGAGPIHHPAAA